MACKHILPKNQIYVLNLFAFMTIHTQCEKKKMDAVTESAVYNAAVAQIMRPGYTRRDKVIKSSKGRRCPIGYS